MTIDALGLEWAIKFHETYERLAPEFGYETRTDTRQFESESKNGRLMIAVCGELIPQAIAADNARLEAERERLRTALVEARTVLGKHHEINYSLPWGGVCPICVPDGAASSIFERIAAALALPAAAPAVRDGVEQEAWDEKQDARVAARLDSADEARAERE